MKEFKLYFCNQNLVASIMLHFSPLSLNFSDFKKSGVKIFHCVKKCPHSELFRSAFSCIGTEYGEILSIFSPNAGIQVQMPENADQNNSE